MARTGKLQDLNLIILIMVGNERISKPKTPLLTVDCVVFNHGRVLLIERGFPPFKGMFALPGGFVDEGESVESACVRELEEETGVVLPLEELELVGVYSEQGRDPRGPTVTVAYRAEVLGVIDLKAGDDARSACFVNDWESRELAFDHKKIISDASMLIKSMKHIWPNE